jgi:threonine/homoserine/homoserine lactone efflux protein
VVFPDDSIHHLGYRHAMKEKLLSCLVFLLGVNVFAGTSVAHVTMPEPSAFPELVLTLGGAGFLLWLAIRWHGRRGSSSPRHER